METQSPTLFIVRGLDTDVLELNKHAFEKLKINLCFATGWRQAHFSLRS